MLKVFCKIPNVIHHPISEEPILKAIYSLLSKILVPSKYKLIDALQRSITFREER